MGVPVSDGRVPGPGGSEAARVLAGMLGDPLAGYVRLAARYGDAAREMSRLIAARRAGAQPARSSGDCWMCCCGRGRRTVGR
jgi:hypothetical protein